MNPSSTLQSLLPLALIRPRIIVLIVVLFGLPGLLIAAVSNPDIDDLAISELAEVPAVLSSKFESLVFDSASASFVFDQNAIENLAVDSIPELLRYAPGVHIVRPSNGIWGIGIRGINSRFFNRVQFTVDEQNVYSTIFAGLFGNQHDLLMDDIASLEVAYGPGGGTWNNNAVNGQVNVLMKTAFETEGTLLKTNIGSESRGAAARVGWSIDETSSARVFAKIDNRDSSDTRDLFSNEWSTARAGFRFDKRPSDKDLISITVEGFYSDLGYAYDLPDFSTGELIFDEENELLKGANTQLKWTRNNPDGSQFSVRSWLAYSDLEAAYAAFDMYTLGMEGRARFALTESNFINFYLGAAYDEEDAFSTLASDFTDDHFSNSAMYTGFQDEWEIVKDRIDLSFGLDIRFEEKSDITTYSPNLRISGKLTENSRIWAAYSESSRTTPVALSVIESLRSGKAIDNPIITNSGTIRNQLIDARSDEELDTETLDAFEIGYRIQSQDASQSFHINAFAYEYDNIFARIGNATPIFQGDSSYLDVSGSYTNLLKGDAYGFEAFFNWKFSDFFDVSFSYSRLEDSFESLIESDDPFVADFIEFSLNEFDQSTSEHLATLNISSDLSKDWNLNTGLRYSSGYEFAKGEQSAIFQMDTRLSWQATEKLRLSLVGRNLLDPNTQDIRLKDFFGHWTETKREIYLEVKANF
ncbi:outer membrane beta-barrel protein [Puniceicoccaceae bacterium K14]|nr:outer membrane beta-barrel protein [Puniceicoccaceae bacterium K14]